jgi:hypothetical protein
MISLEIPSSDLNDLAGIPDSHRPYTFILIGDRINRRHGGVTYAVSELRS